MFLGYSIQAKCVNRLDFLKYISCDIVEKTVANTCSQFRKKKKIQCTSLVDQVTEAITLPQKQEQRCSFLLR